MSVDILVDLYGSEVISGNYKSNCEFSRTESIGYFRQYPFNL